ncbi:hypothetical protein X961_5415 [Burkholderia pseudomallei MSHR5613]|nr:hypothetical protein X961_5415 [Burkholderia pseudomallei MSHR5613]
MSGHRAENRGLLLRGEWIDIVVSAWCFVSLVSPPIQNVCLDDLILQGFSECRPEDR